MNSLSIAIHDSTSFLCTPSSSRLEAGGDSMHLADFLKPQTSPIIISIKAIIIITASMLQVTAAAIVVLDVSVAIAGLDISYAAAVHGSMARLKCESYQNNSYCFYMHYSYGIATDVSCIALLK